MGKIVKDNSVYYENKVTGEIVYLFWVDDSKVCHYMTVNGEKTCSIQGFVQNKKRIMKEIGEYPVSLGIATLKQNV